MMESSINRHIAVIAAATIAALAVWGVLRLAGVDFTLKDDASIESVGFVDDAVTTVVAGLGAWVAHSFILRLRWSRYWTLIGSAVLALSLLGPSRMADGETAVALIVLHLIVGWTLILGMIWAQQERPGVRSWRPGSLNRHPGRG